MNDLAPRLRAVCDLDLAEAREYSGRHEYDGTIQDLSPDGVRKSLAALAEAASSGTALEDPHDEAHLATFEDRARVVYGELELYRRNPLIHLGGLDLACYDRDYAPQEDRDRARLAQLAAWPQAVDAAVTALDQVSAPVATALASGIEGLAGGIPAGAPAELVAAARAAHARLAARLAESCARIDPGRPALTVARELVRDHPGPDGVLDAARHWTEQAIAFTRERDLVPYHDGECLVGLAPESRRWAMAMMSPAAPGEPEGPSWYYITPPDASWPQQEQEEWLEVFSATTLPGITVHEVAPGHFSHGRALRHAPTDVRRTLHSAAFIEGWAHYAEELCVEEGFAAGDPRFEIGVWLEALVRITRLACAIGVHSAGMTVEEGAARFEADTHLAGPAALSEARRATFDPTYGRYTWGKLEILKLRDEARQAWGAGFTLNRFHASLLSLGSPPLGLMGTAIVRG